MYRRAFCTATVAAAASPSGCLSELPSSTAGTPEPSPRRERAGVSAVVTDVSYAGTAGGTETVTASFDCATATATLDGRLSTSSCRTVALGAFSVDPAANTARLAVVPQWDESSPPERTDCAGVTYAYRVRFEAATPDALPREITVVHELVRGDGRRFSVVSDC